MRRYSVFIVLLGVALSRVAFSQSNFPSERELNRRIRAQELEKERERKAEIASTLAARQAKFDRDQGRAEWPEEDIAIMRRITNRPVTRIWAQAKRTKNGTWILERDYVSYSDANFFCKHLMSTDGMPRPYTACYDINGTLLFSSRLR